MLRSGKYRTFLRVFWESGDFLAMSPQQRPAFYRKHGLLQRAFPSHASFFSCTHACARRVAMCCDAGWPFPTRYSARYHCGLFGLRQEIVAMVWASCQDDLVGMTFHTHAALRYQAACVFCCRGGGGCDVAWRKLPHSPQSSQHARIVRSKLTGVFFSQWLAH